MSFMFEKMVAGRYLRSRRREGFISVIAGFSFLGIMLGVATLIVVMSVMNGFREDLIGRILGLNGHLNVYSRYGTLYPYEPLIQRLEKIPGVVSAVPAIEGEALLTMNGSAFGVGVRGLRPEDLAKKTLLYKSIAQKISEEGFFTGDNVAIGVKMAERLGLHTGDRILLIAPKGRASPFGTIPRSRAFIVGAIFNVGMYQYDNSFVFMPLEMAKAFFMMENAVSAIEIMTPDPDHTGGVKRAIQADMADEYGVADWQDNNKSFSDALQVESRVMFLILTLIIIVASFNIISSLIMLVKDKGRDIAILRTMGATRGMVVRIFFYTGATIGVAGTVAGGMLGVAVARNIESIRRWIEKMTGFDLFAMDVYQLARLPTRVDMAEVAGIILMSLLLSFAATIYPAYRAARLDPVEALRRE